MDDREQIIQLGKVLAEEQRRDCDNQAVEGGLEQFLEYWSARANGAVHIPAVREVLTLLQDYDIEVVAVRRERVTRALPMLRALFREMQGQPLQPAPSEQLSTASPPPRSTRSRKKQPERPKLNEEDAIPLDTPVQEIPDIRRNVALAFKRLGIKTVADMLYHFPHRYDDYSSQQRIAGLMASSTETVVGTIDDVRTFPLKRKGSIGIEVLLRDESGTLKVVFFGSSWLLKQFPVGRKIVVSGQVTSGTGYQRGMLQMTRPDWEPYSEDELLHTGRLVPVHPLTKGLHERNARAVIKQVVDKSAPLVEDFVPATVCERANLLPLSEALSQIHFPDDQEMLTRARHRLAFDEFFLIQLGVLRRKIYWQSEMGYAIPADETVHQRLLEQIPFSLTGAQERVLHEIFADIQKQVPMARLLQGDVGSGKTIVAAATILQVIASGLQCALMAPTEILAEQHYNGLRGILGRVRVPRDKQREAQAQNAGDNWQETIEAEELARLEQIKQLLGMTPEEDMGGEGVRVALLTGSLGKKARRNVLEAIEKGEVDLVVGTHALITESVQYRSLGLVCVDEQHRFGVEQRERLKQKGFNPHMLVMTATPIPRTLTLTIYGELDTSVLDELPPGRQEIATRWIRLSEREKAYRHIRKEVEKGRQAFVICPLVEESEVMDLPSAEEMHTMLQHKVFPDLRVGLIHGRLLPREKDVVMRDFRDHQYDILVATAVVEVGIDVPNATTIMIEGAERFGLSQLHQFRGRVGRGAHQSYCILVSDKENEVTTQRLSAMERIRDGFELAEIDLNLRGPGEFFGRRQSGTPDLKMAKLADTRLLNSARLEAETLLADDPHLQKPEHRLLHDKVETFWKDAEGAS
jgi:ATP-dependent DNA helicase RecG